MTMSIRSSYMRVLVCCLVAAASLYGQSVTATLTGIVSDSSGAVIPKTNVALTNVGSGDTRRTITNEAGYFSFVAVPAGDYNLGVEAPGFQKYESA